MSRQSSQFDTKLKVISLFISSNNEILKSTRRDVSAMLDG